MLANSPSNLLSLSIGGRSNAGNKVKNQDAFASAIPNEQEIISKGIAVAIADGVASANYAAQASQLAVTQFICEYYATQDTWSTGKSAAKVLKSLNQWLFSQRKHYCGASVTDRDLVCQQWLTTFTGVIFKSASAYVFHVGDTRFSRFRQGRLEVLTRDHNQKSIGRKGILTRALGADTHLEVDYCQTSIDPEDIYLLTCDGVHDVLSETEITACLLTLPSVPDRAALERVSQKIIDTAITSGSEDNVSCVLVAMHSIPARNIDEIQRTLFAKAIPPALQVGQSLDGYTVKKIIYASVRSHLYLVESSDTKTLYVLKAPSLNFVDDTIYLQGFIREAWVGERIKHKNVMRIIASPTESQFLYHICHYVEGQSLTQWMHDNPNPSLETVRQIIQQIIGALRSFQRLDLVHRDLKPDNVMIDNYGHVTLIDYGTVKVASLDESHLSLEETVPQGSINYIAPETLLEMQADHQSDLFSLGVICYQMLSGALPYKPMTSSGAKIKDYPFWCYISIRQFRQELPLWLDLTLAKALAANPSSRYKSLSEFEVDLRKPNTSTMIDYQQQPLIKRHPLKFWQGLSLTLFILLILSLAF